jgi:hypothetical protein
VLGRSEETGAATGGGRRDAAGAPRPLVGGRVAATGIALVHEGEVIVPGPDSAAEIDMLRHDVGHEIRITLPVVVELAPAADAYAHLDEIVDETLRRLRTAIEAQATA